MLFNLCNASSPFMDYECDDEENNIQTVTLVDPQSDQFPSSYITFKDFSVRRVTDDEAKAILDGILVISQ